MGIRFACPNGHPLHVKADLAGKRGICPHCQAKFSIPLPERVSSSAQINGLGKGSGKGSGNGSENALASNIAPAAPSQVASPAPNAPTPMWYVRPAAGGQFGPAEDTLMQQWVAEGRVGAGDHLWRTGWPDWRRAAEAGEYFPQLAAAARSEVSVAPAASEQSPVPTSLALARYQQRKRRAAQGQMLAAIVLIFLALVLAGVLIYVVMITSSEEPAPEAPTTTAQPAAGLSSLDEGLRSNHA